MWFEVPVTRSLCSVWRVNGKLCSKLYYLLNIISFHQSDVAGNTKGNYLALKACRQPRCNLETSLKSKNISVKRILFGYLFYKGKLFHYFSISPVPQVNYESLSQLWKEYDLHSGNLHHRNGANLTQLQASLRPSPVIQNFLCYSWRSFIVPALNNLFFFYFSSQKNY